MNSILAGLIGYLVVVLIIGFVTYRFMGTLDDFLLGGRRLGAMLIAFSERASGESAWFLLGLPGLAFVSGFSAYWTVIGCAAGIFLTWTLIAKRLRVQTGRFGALTIPDYLEARFQDTSHVLRIVATLIILVFYTVYLGAQFIGAGKVLDATFGLDPRTGMILGAAVVMFYTFMGGFLAVVWTDLVQGLLMVFVAVVLPILGIIEAGGWHTVVQNLQNLNPALLDIGGGQTGRALILGLVIGSLGIGLGYMGQPHLLVRYMAIKTPREIRRGVLVAMLWVLLAYWGAALIGIVGVAYLGPHGVADPEHLMPHLARVLFPGWFAGIVISGAIAAMMSTADSQLLVVTSAVVEDIYRKLFNAEATQRTLVVLSRVVTVVVTLLALALAIYAKQLIYWLVLYAWAGLGASFGPAILLSLWWKRTTRAGVLAGLITGTVVTLIWYNVPALKALVYELVPAFLASLLAVWLVSLATRPPAPEQA